MRWIVVLTALLSCYGPATARQGNDRMTSSAELAVKEAKAGDTVTLKVKLTPKPGFHTYPTKQSAPGAESFVTKLKLRTETAEIKGAIKEPAGKMHDVAGLIYDLYEEAVTLEVPVLIKKETKAGELKLEVQINTQACDEKGCVPYRAIHEVKLLVKEGSAPKKEETKPVVTDSGGEGDGQNDNDRMSSGAEFAVKDARAGELVYLKVTLLPIPGFHTYPTKQKLPGAEAFVTRFTLRSPIADIKGETKEPEGKPHGEADLKYDVFDTPVTIDVPVLIKADAKPGEQSMELQINSQVCDEKGCVPYRAVHSVKLKIVEGVAPTAKTGNDPVKTTAPASLGSKDTKPEPKTNTDEDRLKFLLGAAVAGIVTVFTPCVFPMIPITVSSFLKRKDTTRSQALKTALVYSGTIVVSLTIIALTLLVTFQQLSRSPITNYVLGGIFIFFALSLFGLYEIALPSFITNWTSKGQGKEGYVGIIFTALTFTIISFSCVAPFLGGFAGAAVANRPLLWNIMGAFVFSAAFASPFFLLALFPSVIRSLPKSGGWLNAMKVVMGFIEVAAALKFFRQAELAHTFGDPSFFTYDFVMSLYVILCFIIGIYLLGVFRMPHDHVEPGEAHHIGVLRAMWAVVFLGLGIYFAPAMWRDADGAKLRPKGVIFDWVDSFLLPGEDTKPKPLAARESKGGKEKISHELPWQGDLQLALTEARAKKKRIFIDFTGEI